MPQATTVATVPTATAELIDAPRDDVVGERAAGPGRYVVEHGPFAAYERTVTTGAADADGNVTVVQRFEWRLPRGTWPLLINPAMRRALRGPEPDGKPPWWFPPDRPDRQGASVLGLLASLSVIIGYHGTLLGQSMTFAADEFGSSATAQGAALSWARIGGFLAIALGAAADRRGRRRLVLLSLLLCIGSTVAGAFSPNLAVLATTQAVNRGAWAGAVLLLGVVVAEEMPKGARAYAAGLLSMATALGAGMALWLLPLADLGPRAWRILYLVPLLFLPALARYGRMLPESRRFVRPHTTASLHGHGGRLVLLASAGFLLNVFVGPQTQFRNEFLRDERGLSAAAVSLFALPHGHAGGHRHRGRRPVGRHAGPQGRRGRLRGRRHDAAGRLVQPVGGAGCGSPPPPAGSSPPRSTRSCGSTAPSCSPRRCAPGPPSIVATTAMLGSVLGLLCAGVLRDALGSWGRTMAILALAPLAMAALVLLRFPETAKRELEDINPEDRPGAPPAEFVEVEADADADPDDAEPQKA